MSTLITNQPVAPNRMRGRVRICLDGIRPAFGSDLAAHLHPSHLISVQPNGKADQRRTKDSALPLDSVRRLIQRVVMQRTSQAEESRRLLARKRLIKRLALLG